MKFAKRVESESRSVSDFSKEKKEEGKINKTIHSREERKIDLSRESNSISYLLSLFSDLDQISRTEFLVTFLICLDRRAISSVES